MKNNILKEKILKRAGVSAAAFLISVMLGTMLQGCSDSSNTVSSTTQTDNIGLSVKFNDAALDNPDAAIQITEAKALVSELEIETSDGSSSHEIKLTPFVINFDISGNLKDVLSAYIPSKTYKKIKFQIHKPEDNETPPDPEFNTGGRFSFIIKGTYNGNSFVFKSRKTVNIVLTMNNAINISNTKLNLTMIINKLQWFLQNGGEIDPRNPSNEDTIDDNIRNSFKNVFRDDDRNGIPDDN